MTIKNTSSTTRSLTGYTVRDKANHVYKVGTFSLGGGRFVRIHTGKGTNTLHRPLLGVELARVEQHRRQGVPVTTVTTVGYGDRYPVTPEGRVVGGVLMVVGIATMGAVTAAIASQLINPRQSAQPQPADERVHQLEAQIAHLTAQLDSARGNLTPETDKSRSHAVMTHAAP